MMWCAQPKRIPLPLSLAALGSTAVIAATPAVREAVLPALGSVYYHGWETLLTHPLPCAAATALLVGSVVWGERLLEAGIKTIRHAALRTWMHRWLPGPGVALMGTAFIRGALKVAGHFLSADPPAVSLDYVNGLGAVLFSGFFLVNALRLHLHALAAADRPDDTTRRAVLLNKLACLTDDIPALALVLST